MDIQALECHVQNIPKKAVRSKFHDIIDQGSDNMRPDQVLTTATTCRKVVQTHVPDKEMVDGLFVILKDEITIVQWQTHLS